MQIPFADSRKAILFGLEAIIRGANQVVFFQIQPLQSASSEILVEFGRDSEALVELKNGRVLKAVFQNAA